MHRNTIEHTQLTTITIRETFRKKLRNQQNHKSFQEIRRKMFEQQLQDQQKKDYERFINMAIHANTFFKGVRIQQPQQHQVRNQNYHQNLYGLVNNGNANIGQNGAGLIKPTNNYYDQYLKALENLQQNRQNERPALAQALRQNFFNNPISPPTQPMQPDQPPQQLRAPILKQIKQREAKSVDKKEQQQVKMPQKPKIELTRNKHFIVYNDRLGSGSYATVFKGINFITKQQVAVKQIEQNSKNQNQMRVHKSLSSPYIIKLLHTWSQNKQTYLVLELCERNLQEELERHISFDLKIKYFNDVICGLDALFSNQIIHRDLKFENILISKEKIAKLADFGLAKDMINMSRVVSWKCGTPYTMAPQIFFCVYKPIYSQKCDIWSLGVLLHQMIYNKHPFNTQTQRFKRMERVFVKKSFGYLDELIDRSLKFDPADRIGWEQFKSINESKGYFMNKNILLKRPQEVNFKKKQIKAAEYKADQPSLSDIIKKRIQKQREMQINQKDIQDLINLNKARQLKIKPNNFINNHVEKVEISKLEQRKNHYQGQKMLDQNPRIVQRPIMRMIQENNRQKQAKYRQQLSNLGGLGQVRHIVPPFRPLLQKPQPQPRPAQANAPRTGDHSLELVIKKILFVVVFLILVTTLHDIYRKSY